MKVACIQLTTKKNYKINFKKIIKYINESFKNNADLVITPETSSIMTDEKKILYKYSYRMEDDPLINECKKIAKKYGKWILIGSVTIKVKNKLRNRSIIFNPQGEIINYYDKINMFDINLPNGEKHHESKTYKAGKRLVSVKLPWGILGLSICYDLRFPELYRKLSKKNVSFISVPSAFTNFTGKKHWLALLRARAIENFAYVFAPNQYGKNTPTRETYGHTVIISPNGNILKMKKKGEGIIYSIIDTKLPKKLKNLIPSSYK